MKTLLRKRSYRDYNIRFKNLFSNFEEFKLSINSVLTDIELEDTYNNISPRINYYFLKWNIPNLCYANIKYYVEKHYAIYKSLEETYNKNFEDMLKNKNITKVYDMSSEQVENELGKFQTNQVNNESSSNISFLQEELKFKENKAKIKFNMYDNIINDIIDKNNFYDEYNLYNNI